MIPILKGQDWNRVQQNGSSKSAVGGDLRREATGGSDVQATRHASPEACDRLGRGIEDKTNMATKAGIARKKAQSREPNKESQKDPLSLEEAIRRRAHEIWLRRGQQEGSDVADWLQAEQELLH